MYYSQIYLYWTLKETKVAFITQNYNMFVKM